MSSGDGTTLVVYNRTIEVPDFEEEEKANEVENLLKNAHKDMLQNANVVRADCTQDLSSSQNYLVTLVVKDEETSLVDAVKALEERIDGIENVTKKDPEYYDVILPNTQAELVTRLEEETGDHVLLLKNHVHVWVKPENTNDFIDATRANVEGSIREHGIARFDFLRDRNNTNHFALIEVFRNSEAPGEHKKTAHYLQWRETVEPWMAQKRSAIKTQATVFPLTELAWDSELETLSLAGIDEPSGTN